MPKRPLSAKGHRQAERMGRHLAALGLVPDAIVSSPKVRAARDRRCRGRRGRLPGRRGSPGSAACSTLTDVEAILARRRPARADDARRPRSGLQRLLAVLVGATSLAMRKGALARIDLVGPLEPGAATLRWLIPPDALTDG